MRIHLLEHDAVDFSNTNISLWAAKGGHEVRQTYVCNNESLPPSDSYDWLMVMGGSPNAWDENGPAWIKTEKAYLKEVLARDKPILGICFGAQLLAEALGGEIFPNSEKEIGWYDVTLNTAGRHSFLFKNIPDRFTTFHWHSDHFSLPAGCRGLAGSPPTTNQAFVCAGRPLAGLQFHPEYTREMVTYFTNGWGAEWQPATHVAGQAAVLAQTPHIPGTYWLMENLLENFCREFELPWEAELP